MRAVRHTSVLFAGALISATVAVLPAQAAGTPTTFEVEGTLTVVVADRFGDRPASEHLYTVVTDDGAEIPVALDGEMPANGRFVGELVVDGAVESVLDAKDLLPREGSTIADGTRAGRVAVAAADDQEAPLEVVESSVAPVTAAAVTTPAEHRAYVAVLDNRGSVEESDADVAAIVNGVTGYWRTESGGAITSFDIAEPIAHFSSTVAGQPASSCGMAAPSAVWDEAAELFPGISFAVGSRNHLVVAMADECDGAGIAGVASLGNDFSSGGRLSFSMGDIAAQVGVHEIGHTFGLGHANLATCPSVSICEYFDLYSPMGLAVSGESFAPPALGTLYRGRLGVLGTSETSTVVLPAGQATSEQTFALAPRSAASGLRGLLVTDPQTSSTYAVDWRSRTGRDAGTFYGSVFGLGGPYPSYPAGVVVEQAGPDATTSLTTRPNGGGVTGSFAAGTTFAPSAGLSVTVDAIGSTATVTVRMSLPPVQSATPTISGTARVGQTVTAVPGAWGTGTAFAYDWRVDGVSSGSTGSSYVVPASASGKALTVRVTGSATGLAPVTKESAASTVAPGVLVPGTVTATGTAFVGATLTASPGTWTPVPTFAYQWSVEGQQLGTAATFVVPPSALGKQVVLTVTGTRSGYQPLAAAPFTSAVVGGAMPDLPSATPLVEGTVAVGRTVTASTAAWEPGATLVHDWRLDGISTGVAGNAYTIPPIAVGRTLTVVVSGSKAGFAAVTRTSTASVVGAGTFAPGAVGTTGTATVDSTVFASVGGWPADAVLSFQWERDGVPIAGATGSALTIPASLVGTGVRVVVRGTRPGYQPASAASASSAVAAGQLRRATPRITGTAKVGRTLKVKVGSWSPQPSFRYQWFANGKRITKKGQKSSFRLTSKQKGKRITVRVTGARPGYATVAVTSKRTKKVVGT